MRGKNTKYGTKPDTVEKNTNANISYGRGKKGAAPLEKKEGPNKGQGT